jgi:hypothetical protein
LPPVGMASWDLLSFSADSPSGSMSSAAKLPAIIKIFDSWYAQGSLFLLFFLVIVLFCTDIYFASYFYLIVNDTKSWDVGTSVSNTIIIYCAWLYCFFIFFWITWWFVNSMKC